MQQVLIRQDWIEKLIQLNLKSNVDKLDLDKLKYVPNSLRNLKSQVPKLDVDNQYLLI